MTRNLELSLASLEILSVPVYVPTFKNIFHMLKSCSKTFCLNRVVGTLSFVKVLRLGCYLVRVVTCVFSFTWGEGWPCVQVPSSLRASLLGAVTFHSPWIPHRPLLVQALLQTRHPCPRLLCRPVKFSYEKIKT